MPAQPSLLEFVQQHGQEDDQSQDDLLGVGLDVHQIHAVLNHSDDEGPNQGAEDFPSPPERLVPPTTTAAITYSSYICP